MSFSSGDMRQYIFINILFKFNFILTIILKNIFFVYAIICNQ
jgi:hypothetical protein